MYVQGLDRGNLGAVTMHIEEAFLSELDSGTIWKRISSQINGRGILEDRELMHMIIYPLTFRKIPDKQSAIQRTIELADSIKSERQRVFALTGLMVFCDKVISGSDADQIRSMLMMTKLDKMFAKEVQAAVDANTKEVTESVTRKVEKRVKRNVTRNVTKRIAINFLNAGSSPEFVASNTGLPLEYVQKLSESHN